MSLLFLCFIYQYFPQQNVLHNHSSKIKDVSFFYGNSFRNSTLQPDVETHDMINVKLRIRVENDRIRQNSDLDPTSQTKSDLDSTLEKNFFSGSNPPRRPEQNLIKKPIRIHKLQGTLHKLVSSWSAGIEHACSSKK